jgi:hypothetical protein
MRWLIIATAEPLVCPMPLARTNVGEAAALTALPALGGHVEHADRRAGGDRLPDHHDSQRHSGR